LKLLLLTLLPLISFSNSKTYYPQEFYQKKLNDKTQRPEPKSTARLLTLILKSAHLEHNSGGVDKLISKCSGQKNCYSHRALDYSKEARTIVMGILTGKKVSKNLIKVESVYCNKVYDVTVTNGYYRIPDHTKFNVEHTMPQSRFNQGFNRRTQKSDLHNLYPTVNRVNSLRSSWPFAELQGHNYPISGCKTSEFTGSFFEPPAKHKGNVARALAYFALNYKIYLKPHEKVTIVKWNELDPVDEEEARRNDIIFHYQHNRNPFVDYPHLVNIFK